MNSLAQAITGFFGGSGTATLGAFAAAMAAIGVITMALIQAVKDVTPVRRMYQRHRLRRWLTEGATEARTRHAKYLAGVPDANELLSVDLAESDLLCLAVDNDADALYDLTIEQMCGQINSAYQMVLDYTYTYRRLLLLGASAASPDDVELLITTQRSQFARPDGMTAEQKIAYADARNRVSHQLQRAVDAFQIAASYRWKWSMQLASFVISALIAIAAVMADQTTERPILTVVFTGIIAGFLAPVARDLAAAIQKLRTP